ncbi:LytR C-terminal domain-containing protein [Paraherbaspirillum soli]|uniref:LytR C-terminal domain-containing protein n=1 Tax=Paraherbaspirillum soli TaxID=631222 RepID=A0ABW0MEA1_9BURK
MNKIFLLLPLVCGVPALSGCSSAIPRTEKAMRVQPVLSVRNSDSSARGFYQLGLYYQGQNRLEPAADAYRKALALQGSYIEAHNALGTTYSLQGKFDQAIAEFQLILQTKPQLAHIYNNLGYTYYLQQHFGEAIAAYEKAIALDQSNPRTYNNLGAAYAKLGETEKSRLAIARSVALNAHHAEAAPAASTNADIEAGAALALTQDTGSVALPPLTSGASVAMGSDTIEVAASAEHAQDGRAPIARALLQYERWGQRLDPATPMAPIQAMSPAIHRSTRDGKTFRLEIANGNGIAGLARKVSDTLASHGLPISNLINLKPYRQQKTSIQYRKGFRDEALRLSRKLPTSPSLVSNDHLRDSVDVQLILGKDVTSLAALSGADAATVIQLSGKMLAEQDKGH